MSQLNFSKAPQTKRHEEVWRQRFHSTGESSLSSPEEESSSTFSRSPLEEVEESSEDSNSFSSGHEWPGSDCSGEEPARVHIFVQIFKRVNYDRCTPLNLVCLGWRIQFHLHGQLLRTTSSLSTLSNRFVHVQTRLQSACIRLQSQSYHWSS